MVVILNIFIREIFYWGYEKLECGKITIDNYFIP